jgi:hypothetical protein
MPTIRKPSVREAEYPASGHFQDIKPIAFDLYATGDCALLDVTA